MSYLGNNPSQQSFTPAVDYFNGTGSATAFTLSRPVSTTAQVQVTIENVPQNPSSSFTVSGSTITFTSAPPSGTSNIYVQYTSPITQVIAPGQGTVNTTSMASSTGTGAGVFQTSPTITTPTISTITSAAATALTLQSAGTTAVTIDTSQNVTLASTLTANGNVSTANGSVYGWGSFSSYIGGNSATNIVNILTNSTERMRIDSSGNLLVGCTTTPSPTVAGRAIYGGAGFFQSSCGTTTTTYTHFFFTNGNGNVGTIGTNGSSTAYNTSSDYRLKNTIAPMTGALAKVALLKPVTYKWNVDGSDGQGFIAHELQEVVEGCVTGEKDATREEEYEVTPTIPAIVDSDGKETSPAVEAVKGTRTVPSYQGVDTSFLIATLSAAIQELKAIVDTQAARITALEAK